MQNRYTIFWKGQKHSQWITAEYLFPAEIFMDKHFFIFISSDKFHHQKSASLTVKFLHMFDLINYVN